MQCMSFPLKFVLNLKLRQTHSNEYFLQMCANTEDLSNIIKLDKQQDVAPSYCLLYFHFARELLVPSWCCALFLSYVMCAHDLW